MNPTDGLQITFRNLEKMDTLGCIGLYTAHGYKNVNLQHLEGTAFI